MSRLFVGSQLTLSFCTYSFNMLSVGGWKGMKWLDSYEGGLRWKYCSAILRLRQFNVFSEEKSWLVYVLVWIYWWTIFFSAIEKGVAHNSHVIKRKIQLCHCIDTFHILLFSEVLYFSIKWWNMWIFEQQIFNLLDAWICSSYIYIKHHVKLI